MNTTHDAGACSRDALWRGRLPLWQPARGHGYRFNLDSVLLADFAPALPHAAGLELGAGCGIIGLMLLAQGKLASLTAVERQGQLASLLRRNVTAYRWQGRVQVVAGDLRCVPLPRADMVVFNPPYFARAAGRPAQEPGRDQGRRECFGALADFVAHGARALAPGGQLVAIVPYARRRELEALLRRAGLAPGRRRAVQNTPVGPPRHLLVAAQACDSAVACALEALPPLVVHRAGGGYSDEVATLIEGPAAWTCPPCDGEGPRP